MAKKKAAARGWTYREIRTGAALAAMRFSALVKSAEPGDMAKALAIEADVMRDRAYSREAFDANNRRRAFALRIFVDACAKRGVSTQAVHLLHEHVAARAERAARREEIERETARLTALARTCKRCGAPLGGGSETLHLMTDCPRRTR